MNFIDINFNGLIQCTRDLGNFQPLYKGSTLNRKNTKANEKTNKIYPQNTTYNSRVRKFQRVETTDTGNPKPVQTQQNTPSRTNQVDTPIEWENIHLLQDGPQTNERPKTPKRFCLSTRSKLKIRRKVFAWFHTERRFRTYTRFTFVTLTFINYVDHKKAVKLLNNFLTWARMKNGHFRYLWVAELQPNSGHIHFHLLTNFYWPVHYYNKYWLKLQLDNGITQKDGKTDLNPFDVKRIKKHEELAYYITKYITKNTSEFDCQMWNCSRDISALFTSLTHDTSAIDGYYYNSNNYYFHKKTKEKIVPEIRYNYATQKDNRPDLLISVSYPVAKHHLLLPLLNKLYLWNCKILEMEPLQRFNTTIPRVSLV